MWTALLWGGLASTRVVRDIVVSFLSSISWCSGMSHLLLPWILEIWLQHTGIFYKQNRGLLLIMDSKLGIVGYYQLGVTQQPHKTIYSCHFLLERLFSENALAITSIPMEVWLNNKPFGSLGHWHWRLWNFFCLFFSFFFFLLRKLSLVINMY